MNIRAFNGIVPRLGANAYVDADALVIGDVELGEDASIWPGAVVRGDVQRIRVGAPTSPWATPRCCTPARSRMPA